MLVRPLEHPNGFVYVHSTFSLRARSRTWFSQGLDECWVIRDLAGYPWPLYSTEGLRQIGLLAQKANVV